MAAEGFGDGDAGKMSNATFLFSSQTYSITVAVVVGNDKNNRLNKNNRKLSSYRCHRHSPRPLLLPAASRRVRYTAIVATAIVAIAAIAAIAASCFVAVVALISSATMVMILTPHEMYMRGFVFANGRAINPLVNYYTEKSSTNSNI